MNLRTLSVMAALLMAPLATIGQSSADPYTGFVSRVQEKLRELGFDAGAVNGDFGGKTQAARDDPQVSAGASSDASAAPGQRPEPETAEKPGS